MKVTVIGTGNMGSGFAKQLSNAGHSVRITGRDFEKAKALADQYPNVTAYIASEALGDRMWSSLQLALVMLSLL